MPVSQNLDLKTGDRKETGDKKEVKIFSREKWATFVHSAFILLMVVLVAGYIFFAVKGYPLSHVYRKDWVSAAGGFFLAISFIFTLSQLRQAQRDQRLREEWEKQHQGQREKWENQQKEWEKQRESWERTKFITEQMSRFRADPDVADVKDMLESIDSTVERLIMLPDEQGKLVLTKVPREMLINAFTIGKLSCRRCHSLAEVSIAKKFDMFFTHFISFGDYKRLEIIEADHLRPYLYYWYELIVEIDHAKKKQIILKERSVQATEFCTLAEQQLKQLKREGGTPGDIEKAEKKCRRAQDDVASANEAVAAMREIEPDATRVREQMNVYRNTYFKNFDSDTNYLHGG